MKLYFIALLISLASCAGPTRENIKVSEAEKVFTQITGMHNSELILVSTLNRSILLSDTSIFSVAVTNQNLIFKTSGVEIKKTSPILPTDHKSGRGSQATLDCIIYELGILPGTKEDLFIIRGAGLCNACPELFAFYNKRGVCVWLTYSNKYKIYNSIGSFEGVCEEYGVDSILWQKGDYRKIEVVF